MVDWRGGADAAALAGAGLEDRAVLRTVLRREADAAAALGAPALRVGDWPCPIPSPGCASAASTSDENQCKQNDPGAKDLHGAADRAAGWTWGGHRCASNFSSSSVA